MQKRMIMIDTDAATPFIVETILKLKLQKKNMNLTQNSSYIQR